MHSDELGSQRSSEYSCAELEQLRALAEDARNEATAAVEERDAAVAERDRLSLVLQQMRAQVEELQRALTAAEEARAAQESSGDVLAEELRVAFEELQTGAEELETANGELLRINDRLEAEVAARTMQLGATASRLQTITDVVPSLVWASNPGGDWTWCNQRWIEFTGQTEPEARGFGWLDCVHPDDRAGTMRAWADGAKAGQLHVEHRLRDATRQEWRWFVTRALPVRQDTASEPSEWVGTSTDIDTARRAMIALENSEAQFRDFAAASPDVLWIRRFDTGAFEFVSPAFEAIWGERSDAVRADPARWEALLHPENRDATRTMLQAVGEGRRHLAEFRILRADDATQRWIRETAFPVRDAQGQVQRVAGIARDITERKLSENQQALLMRELDHRVKNALMLAQALAAQTAHSTSDLQGFATTFNSRLRALAAAQDLLTSVSRREVALRSILERTLAPYDGRAERVALDGPPVQIPGTQVVILHMAFHELATNAAKHGALSGMSGRVHVGWRMEHGDGRGGMLQMSWVEQGGPRLEGQVFRQGFGTRLLRHALPRQLGGTAELHLETSGLRYSLRMPLASSEQP